MPDAPIAKRLATGMLVTCFVGGNLVAQAAATRVDVFARAKREFLANRVAASLPLFEAAVRARPRDAERHAWYADAARRLNDWTLARRAASKALKIDPCQSVAHEVLAYSYDPRYEPGEPTSSDSNRVHLQAAVRCDPKNGSAWMSVWINALQQRDTLEQTRSMAALRATDLWTGPWLTHARWVLTTLPDRAIALANGDADTYPPSLLQRTEQLRRDVVIVNVSLLELPWYAQMFKEQFGIPLPGGKAASSDEIVAFWLQEAVANRLGRPLIMLQTLDSDLVSRNAANTTLAGPFWRIGPNGPHTDTTAIVSAFELARTYSWRGAAASPIDRSPVRQATMHPVAMVGAMLAAAAETDSTITRRQLTWIRTELQASGDTSAYAAWLRQFLTKLRIR
jgi:tetratricopeptide (TPR) repeat protein